jgi:urease accessory protein UreF
MIQYFQFFQQAQRQTELLKEQLERAHAGIHCKRQGAKERYNKAVERHEAVLEAQVEHAKGMEQQLKLKAHLAAQIENSVEDYVRGLKKGQAVYENIRTEVCKLHLSYNSLPIAVSWSDDKIHLIHIHFHLRRS